MKACTRSGGEVTFYLGATHSKDCIRPVSPCGLSKPLHLLGRTEHRRGETESQSPENVSWKPLPSSSLSVATAWAQVEEGGSPGLGAADGGGRTVKEVQWWVLPRKRET